MKTISEVISGELNLLTSSGIRRINYSPYNMDFALKVAERIAKGIDDKFEFTQESTELYKKLIQYFHGDDNFPGDLLKGIILLGPTGCGKTLAMKVMSVYQKIDDVKFIMNRQVYRMNFDVIHVNEMVNGFVNNAFDGIQVYCSRYVLCLDDIGTEVEKVKYYGNELDVISYIISERQAKRLLTFGTSNYPVDTFEDKYGDRVLSRMYALFNFITVLDKDFRRI